MLSLYSSTHLSIHLCLSIHPSIRHYLSIQSSICLSIHPSTYPSIHLSACPSVIYLYILCRLFPLVLCLWRTWLTPMIVCCVCACTCLLPCAHAGVHTKTEAPHSLSVAKRFSWLCLRFTPGLPAPPHPQSPGLAAPPHLLGQNPIPARARHTCSLPLQPVPAGVTSGLRPRGGHWLVSALSSRGPEQHRTPAQEAARVCPAGSEASWGLQSGL